MANYLTLVEQLSTAVDQLNQVLQGDETTTVDINGKVQPSVQKKTLDEVNAKIQLVLDAAADIDAVKYTTTAAGIAATADGQFFSVVSDDDENYLDLYKNNSGVAEFKKSYPSTEKLNGLMPSSNAVHLMTTVGSIYINVDLKKSTVTVPMDTIVSMGIKKWIITSEQVISYEDITSTAKMFLFNTATGLFEFRVYSHNYSVQEAKELVLVGALRTSGKTSFTINGRYTINGIRHTQSENQARTILNRTRDLPNLNTVNKTLTFFKDTVFIYDETAYALSKTLTITLDEISTTSRIYFVPETEELIETNWTNVPYGKDYNSGVLVCTMRKPTTTDINVEGSMDIGVPYNVDGRLFGEVPPLALGEYNVNSLVPIITSRGGLPDLRTTTGHLFIPNDTIIQLAGSSYILPEMNIDLDLASGRSTKRVYYSRGSGNVSVVEYLTVLTPPQIEDWLLIAVIRLHTPVNSYMSIACPYRVDGIAVTSSELAKKKDKENAQDFVGIFTPLIGSELTNLKYPNFDRTLNTFTLYSDTILIYGNIRNILSQDVVIDTSQQSSSAFKILWNPYTEEFIIKTWSNLLTSTELRDYVVVAFIRTTIYGTTMSMSCPYTVDGNLFGLDLSDRVIENGLDEYVKAIAHRGYSIVAPENTIPAYAMARKQGFKYFECDVEWTSDGVPVLLHDSTIDRTSNGTGNVKDLTLTELRQYDFGSWKGAEYADTQIPTLEGFLLFCKKVGAHPYIELKGTITPEQATVLKQVVVDSGLKHDHYSFISFSSVSLSRISAELPKARLGLVGTMGQPIIDLAITLRNGQNEVFIDVSHASVVRDSVKLASNAGFELEVWTVNQTDRALELASIGVSGISTDIVNVKKEIINSL